MHGSSHTPSSLPPPGASAFFALECFHAHQTAICVLRARSRRLAGAVTWTLSYLSLQMGVTKVGGVTTDGEGHGPRARLREVEVRTRFWRENMWRQDPGSWPWKRSVQWMTRAAGAGLSSLMSNAQFDVREPLELNFEAATNAQLSKTKRASVLRARKFTFDRPCKGA